MISERVRVRLEKEPVIWMTTVRSDGQPQPSVVWFIVDGDEILMYSKRSIRVKNVKERPRVALNLNSTEWGGSVVSMQATAEVDESAPLPKDNPAFLEKYGDRIREYRWTPESFGRDYPVPIRMTIDRVRAM